MQQQQAITYKPDFRGPQQQTSPKQLIVQQKLSPRSTGLHQQQNIIIFSPRQSLNNNNFQQNDISTGNDQKMNGQKHCINLNINLQNIGKPYCSMKSDSQRANIKKEVDELPGSVIWKFFQRKTIRNFHPFLAIFEYLYLRRTIGEENIRFKIDPTKNFPFILHLNLVFSYFIMFFLISLLVIEQYVSQIQSITTLIIFGVPISFFSYIISYSLYIKETSQYEEMRNKDQSQFLEMFQKNADLQQGEQLDQQQPQSQEQQQQQQQNKGELNEREEQKNQKDKKIDLISEQMVTRSVIFDYLSKMPHNNNLDMIVQLNFLINSLFLGMCVYQLLNCDLEIGGQIVLMSVYGILLDQIVIRIFLCFLVGSCQFINYRFMRKNRDESLVIEIHNVVKQQQNQIQNEIEQRMNSNRSQKKVFSQKNSPEKMKNASAKKGQNFKSDSPSKKVKNIEEENENDVQANQVNASQDNIENNNNLNNMSGFGADANNSRYPFQPVKNQRGFLKIQQVNCDQNVSNNTSHQANISIQHHGIDEEQTMTIVGNNMSLLCQNNALTPTMNKRSLSKQKLEPIISNNKKNDQISIQQDAVNKKGKEVKKSSNSNYFKQPTQTSNNQKLNHKKSNLSTIHHEIEELDITQQTQQVNQDEGDSSNKINVLIANSQNKNRQQKQQYQQNQNKSKDKDNLFQKNYFLKNGIYNQNQQENQIENNPPFYLQQQVNGSKEYIISKEEQARVFNEKSQLMDCSRRPLEESNSLVNAVLEGLQDPAFNKYLQSDRKSKILESQRNFQNDENCRDGKYNQNENFLYSSPKQKINLKDFNSPNKNKQNVNPYISQDPFHSTLENNPFKQLKLMQIDNSKIDDKSLIQGCGGDIEDIGVVNLQGGNIQNNHQNNSSQRLNIANNLEQNSLPVIRNDDFDSKQYLNKHSNINSNNENYQNNLLGKNNQSNQQLSLCKVESQSEPFAIIMPDSDEKKRQVQKNKGLKSELNYHSKSQKKTLDNHLDSEILHSLPDNNDLDTLNHCDGSEAKQDGARKMKANKKEEIITLEQQVKYSPYIEIMPDRLKQEREMILKNEKRLNLLKKSKDKKDYVIKDEMKKIISVYNFEVDEKNKLVEKKREHTQSNQNLNSQRELRQQNNINYNQQQKIFGNINIENKIESQFSTNDISLVHNFHNINIKNNSTIDVSNIQNILLQSQDNIILNDPAIQNNQDNDAIRQQKDVGESQQSENEQKSHQQNIKIILDQQIDELEDIEQG